MGLFGEHCHGKLMDLCYMHEKWRGWDSESAGMPGQRLTFMVAMLSFVMRRGTDAWCSSMCFVHTCMISQECRCFSELLPWPSSLSSSKSPVSPSQSLEILVNLSSEHVQARTKKDKCTVLPKTKQNKCFKKKMYPQCTFFHSELWGKVQAKTLSSIEGCMKEEGSI